MGIANLANVPSTPEEIAIYAFSNMDEHRKTADAIFRSRGKFLPLAPLDPLPLDALGTWAQNHQQMHNDVNAVLGTAGADLTNINFGNADQLAAWSWLHFREHQMWQSILGTN